LSTGRRSGLPKIQGQLRGVRRGFREKKKGGTLQRIRNCKGRMEKKRFFGTQGWKVLVGGGGGGWNGSMEKRIKFTTKLEERGGV